MSAPSHDDLYEQGRVTTLVTRPDLLLSPGDAADLPARAGAAMADLLIGHIAGRVRATFLDGAEGDDLTTLARDHWNVERNAAVASIGEVTFSHTPGPVGSIPAGTRVASLPGVDGQFVTVTTDVDAVFGGGDASQTVSVTATLGGTAGNVQAATLTRILDGGLFDTFTVTNAARLVGGAEAQTDDELRAEVRGLNQTLRRGTIAALEFGAKQVAAVKVATVVEDLAGFATLYVSDADGNSNAAMVSAVQAEIVNWRAASVTVSVVGGDLVTQDIDLSLAVRVGVAVAPLVDRIRQAVSSEIKKQLRQGDTLFRDLIRAAARAVDQDAIVNVVVNVPAVDVVPAGNQVIRAGLVTVGGV
jgi:uncharacterized phage protein gp47/JayE